MLITMKFLPLLLSLSLFFGTTSCKEKNPEPAKNQMAEVMAIHDEVMPRMGEIGKLVATLKPMADSAGQDSKYHKSMRELQEAHKSMFSWMREFGDRFDPDEILHGKELTEQKQAWLDEEEKKVRALREEINGSIARAKKVLEETR